MSSPTRDRQRQASFKEPLNSFLNTTSLHGMGWIALSDQRPWYYDWFFFLAISTGLLCAFTLVFIQVQDYRKDKVRTTFDSELATIADVSFPGITVCNINRIRQSFLNEFGLAGYLPLIRSYFWGTGDTEVRFSQEDIEAMRELLFNKTKEQVEEHRTIVDYGTMMQAFENMRTSTNASNNFTSTFKAHTIMNFFLLAGIQHPGNLIIPLKRN